jgi:hypothetical protein
MKREHMKMRNGIWKGWTTQEDKIQKETKKDKLNSVA